MSTFSTTTDSNIIKPLLNEDLNYQKLQKFNKFYLSNSNFTTKTKAKMQLSNNIENILNIDMPFTPSSSSSKNNFNNIHSRNINTPKL